MTDQNNESGTSISPEESPEPSTEAQDSLPTFQWGSYWASVKVRYATDEYGSLTDEIVELDRKLRYRQELKKPTALISFHDKQTGVSTYTTLQFRY